MAPAPEVAVIAVTEAGARLAQRIATELGAELHLPRPLAAGFHAVPYDSLGYQFARLMDGTRRAIVAVMAQGIVTRMIAPHLRSKYTDPAVVTCDEVGRFAISTASGHEGGANLLAHAVASITGATPVITTATEANRRHVLGIGCRRGTPQETILHAITTGCQQAGIASEQLRLLASAWVKKDEAGLLAAASSLGLYLRFLPQSAYQNPLFHFIAHDGPMRHLGIPGVAEPSALLAAANPRLLLPRTVIDSVTIAIVQEEFDHV
ncbi:cobalamin biosynthesis protein [Desulfurispira natronophila]|uniref:Cobalt-precorrin 5A hydrolase n=1 Tax=Desulfurispira natronophila TaxID=682562 RepID=A0A7W7Y5Q7_9BACT|nr:cobalamin biosynthesis protein [Desulfurispira natronophila]MBB5022549.1 cobalt-precorrin 5A hydrolase [Desulfurispira natronophila]